MFDLENFRDYVGGSSGQSYSSGLKRVESDLGVNIDSEYTKDKCKGLINTVEEKKKDNRLSSLERKYWSDRCSHLRKYVEFKELMDNNNKEQFSKWIAKQPQKTNPSAVYSSLSCAAFIRALEKGLISSANLDYRTANFFLIDDVLEVNYRREKYKVAIQRYDERNRNSDFKNAIEFYAKFLKEKNGKDFNETSEDLFNSKISDIIENYKLNFTKIDKEERFKWEAIKHYKDNWNIDAPDFAEMLERAFAKTSNLLTAGQYFARKMLVIFSQEHPEEVRKLFKILYDESLPLAERFDSFRSGFDGFIDGQKINHYQDLHAVSVYLAFEYPEKYCIYKYSVWTDFLKNIGEPVPSSKGKHETFKIENSNEICDKILDLVIEDRELCSMSQSRLNQTCYDDPTFRLLAFDIMFFGSYYSETEDGDSWWPSLEEYNPNLSKEDWKKYILEIELPEHPCPMQMLKAMMSLGGEASCKQLSQNFGGTPSYYVGCTMNLGRRVKKYFHLPPCMDGEQERYFPFPFLGRALDNEEGHQYIYKIRPELLEALNEIDLSNVSPYNDPENITSEIFADIKTSYTKTDFLEDVYISAEKYETCVSRLKHKKNLILQGAPGVGKTFAARRLAWSVMGVKDDNRIKFVQFHQSYSYEDFIMGYKPDGNGFSLEKGIFYDFCIKATEDPDNDYFFIIDEINRGNMSKIFGELLMLIENDYRGMEITLAYDKKPFSVPENLYIIGMMNTADRSLAMIDYALRRRFSFVEMTPGFNSEGFEAYQSTISNNTFGKLISRIKALNADIENDASLGKGFCIGHSYFCNLNANCSDAVLKEIVEYDIVPMLEEYWFDDEAKAKNWSNDLSGVFNG